MADDDDAPVVDAELVPDDAPAAPQHGSALATRPSNEVIAPLDTAATQAAMAAYQEGLRTILADSDWQNAGRGEKFVKKSGWRKIAAWFGLSIELVRDHVDRDDDGQVTRAQVWARAIAPNGRYADGDGHCDVKESRFDRNKAKLENDLRGTAATRAINRAISNLVGMGAVSAEEMEGTTVRDRGPRFGPAASDDLRARAERAVAYVLAADPEVGPDDPRIKQQADSVIAGIIEADDGYLPAVVADAIRRVAMGLRELVEPAGNATKEDSSGSSDSTGADGSGADGGAEAGDGTGPGEGAGDSGPGAEGGADA